MPKIKSIRGMSDIIPQDIGIWHAVEDSIRSIFNTYGYEEIRFPVVEKTELFSRSVGEFTDIVAKEMYTFKDKKGDGIALRPEGTAGCVRACLEHDLLRVDSPRLWYMGPMFRYERPQKGRSRQFHQASAEVFGIKDPHIDAELIMLTRSLWEHLGINNKLSLHINSLGSAETQAKYKTLLQKYFEPFIKELDKDSKRKIEENPLRILDSKLKEVISMLDEAPKILDYLDKESEVHFNQLKNLLDKAKIPFEVNHKLVRGLDYYNKTVFEWKANDLGSQDTVCGGGRYDSLVEQLGGKSYPAAGFSIGIERLILILNSISTKNLSKQPVLDCFMVCLSKEVFSYALLCSEEIRKKVPGVNLKLNLEATSANSQFKKADKSGANLAIIIGEEEKENKTLSIKYLREKIPQETISLDLLINKLLKFFGE